MDLEENKEMSIDKLQEEEADHKNREKEIKEAERREAEELSKLRGVLKTVVQEVYKNDPTGEKINSLILRNEQWENKARQNEFCYLDIVKEALKVIIERDIWKSLDEKTITQIGTDINVIADDLRVMISNRGFFVHWYYNFLKSPKKNKFRNPL